METRSFDSFSKDTCSKDMHDAEGNLSSALLSPDNTDGSVLETMGFDAESQKLVEQKWQRVRCYGFDLAGLNALAPIGVYCEILTQLRIEPLPNSPPHFLGLTNVRGNLIPVYQLEPLLNRAPINNNYAVLIGNLDQAGALLIPHKPKQFDLSEFSTAEHSDSLPEFIQSAVSQFYLFNGRPWYLLNHSALFRNLAAQNLNLFASSNCNVITQTAD